MVAWVLCTQQSEVHVVMFHLILHVSNYIADADGLSPQKIKTYGSRQGELICGQSFIHYILLPYL